MAEALESDGLKFKSQLCRVFGLRPQARRLIEPNSQPLLSIKWGSSHPSLSAGGLNDVMHVDLLCARQAPISSDAIGGGEGHLRGVFL